MSAAVAAPAVATASTVETASTVGPATAVGSTAASAMVSTTTANGACAMISTAAGVTTSVAAATVVTGIAAAVAAAPVTPDVTAPVPATTPISTMTPAPVIPRSNADKYSACEPLRTIKAIRCARIGIVRVVAVSTDRRSADIPWAGVRLIGIAPVRIALVLVRLVLVGVTRIVSRRNSRFNLRLRVSKRQRQHCQQRKIFHVSHMNPCSRPVKTLFGSANLLKTGGLFGVPSCHRPLATVSIYLNAGGEEKLQKPGWLISAILAKFNHLRASAGARP